MHGIDKGAIVVDGVTIRERQLAVLAAVADDILVVGVESPAAPPARSIVDRVPGRGPLGGLDTALFEARHDPVVVLAADMPFVTCQMLAHFLTLALETDVDAVVPRTERGYHPLCAVYRQTARRAIEDRLRAGRLAMIGLLDDLRVRVVEGRELVALGDPERLLTNVNTPADVESLRGLKIHEL
jgi:molybdopterin-guanine dinucleotide biosynthesis protein A